MTCEEYQELAAHYALDPWGDAARGPLVRHLGICAACRAAYGAFREAVTALPYALAGPAPRPELKDRLMARVNAERPPVAVAAPVASVPTPASTVTVLRPERLALSAAAPPTWARGAVAAAVVCGIGLAGAAWKLDDTGRQLAKAQTDLQTAREAGQFNLGQLDALEKRLADQGKSMEAMRHENKQQGEQLAVLMSRDVKMASMPGQPMMAGASAHVFWSPTKMAWLVTFMGMPKAKAGMTYQLWAVTTAGAKVNMGTFRPDAGGHAMVRASLPRLGMKPAAAAVSVEPEGGMPQPTGPIVMVGDIKKI